MRHSARFVELCLNAIPRVVTLEMLHSRGSHKKSRGEKPNSEKISEWNSGYELCHPQHYELWAIVHHAEVKSISTENLPSASLWFTCDRHSGLGVSCLETSALLHKEPQSFPGINTVLWENVGIRIRLHDRDISERRGHRILGSRSLINPHPRGHSSFSIPTP